jgi:hypothetical protein
MPHVDKTEKSTKQTFVSKWQTWKNPKTSSHGTDKTDKRDTGETFVSFVSGSFKGLRKNLCPANDTPDQDAAIVYCQDGQHEPYPEHPSMPGIIQCRLCPYVWRVEEPLPPGCIGRVQAPCPTCGNHLVLAHHTWPLALCCVCECRESGQQLTKNKNMLMSGRLSEGVSRSQREHTKNLRTPEMQRARLRRESCVGFTS